MSSIYGHGLCFQRTAANRRMKTEQYGGLVCLSLTMDLHRIWRKTHLSKPKMKLYKKLHLFSLFFCLSWDLPVSLWDHYVELKTVSLMTWEVCVAVVCAAAGWEVAGMSMPEEWVESSMVASASMMSWIMYMHLCCNLFHWSSFSMAWKQRWWLFETLFFI